MRKLKLLSLSLLSMMAWTNAMAQVDIPTPAGRWTFDDTSDLLKKEGGGMSLTPCTSGISPVEEKTIAQANITATTGPTSANKAVKIPAASALKVNRASGATDTKNYAIMMDVKVANASPFCSLLQTGNNTNDGDLFFSQNKIGSSQLGGYSGAIISNGTWHRVVLTRRGGNYAYVFVDGTLVLTADFTKQTNHDGTYTLDSWGFYLFCDDGNEKQDLDVAEVAYWETGLSDAQVAALSTYKSYICDGVTYDISSAAGLKNLADFTNAGYNTVNARLVSDVSMSGESWPKPIGDWSSSDVRTAYKGHFDGQGHTISNLTYTTARSFHGLFGVVSSAVIENLTVSGTISNAAYTQFGTIGFARDNGVTIRNVHSSLDITSTANTKTIGGILGHVYNNSTVSIDRCSYSGTLTVTDNAASDDGLYGGILGHVYNNANANISITNCLFDGRLVNTTTAPSNGCVMGGIVGWIGQHPIYSVTNCLSVGNVSNTVSGQICGVLKGEASGGKLFSNNYYKGDALNGTVGGSVTVSASKVTDEQLASGEVAYKLGSAWHQILGTDAHPAPDSSKPNVYKMTVGEAGWASFVPEVNVPALPTGVTAYAGQKNGNYVHLEEVTELPADNAFIVKADEGDYYYNNKTGSITLGVTNDLAFSSTSFAANGTQYCLANGESGIGFYQVQSGISIPARKAYLTVSAAIKEFYGFEDDDATSINEELRMKNEELNEEAAIYNLAGQRTSKLQKGINIINGKKVLF